VSINTIRQESLEGSIAPLVGVSGVLTTFASDVAIEVRAVIAIGLEVVAVKRGLGYGSSEG
jgi:hypothetical protein